MQNTLEWPINKINIVRNFLGLDVDIFEQTFGALSQNPNDPLSRVEVANSSFSIDACRGCPLGCAYCVTGSSKRDLNLEKKAESNCCDVDGLFIKKPEVIFSGDKLVTALVHHPAFIKDKSVISIATASSEAFIEPNSEETWKILNYLMHNGYKNPIWIVTKIGIPENLIAIWKKRLMQITDNNIKVIISVSYSNLPLEIEPHQADRFKSIEKLLDTGVYISHHLRPVIRNINDDIDSIEKCLSRSLPLVRSVCVGGLRLDPGIILAWKYGKKLPTDILPSKPGVKDLPDDYRLKVEKIMKKSGYDLPIFDRSSQVICHAMGWEKDYNLYSYRESKDGEILNVPNDKQKQIEKELGKSVLEVITEAAEMVGLSSLKFSKNGTRFKVLQKLNYQEERALIHAIGHLQIL